MKLDKIVWNFIDYKTDAGESAGAQSGAGAENAGSRTMWGALLRDIQAGHLLLVPQRSTGHAA